MTPTYSDIALILLVSCAATTAHAQLQSATPQDPAVASEIILPSVASASQNKSMELTVGGEELSAGYGNWTNETLLGSYQIDQHVLQMELSSKEEFRVVGTFVGIADTIVLDPDWFTRISVGAGDGAFYLPKIRGDIFLSRKWMENRNFITTVGLGEYDAPDGHIDRNLNFGGTYYFEQPWIVEAGFRLNRSNPNAISTHQQFVAVTYGSEKKDIVTARYGWGGEGYLTIADNVSLVDFESHESSLAWRHWLSPKLGLVSKIDYYVNPYYQRKGANIGLFYQF